MSSVRIIHNGRALDIEDVPCTDILSLLRIYGINMHAPCGGKGTCGKCAVFVSKDGGEKKKVLACQTQAERGMTITVPEEGFGSIESLSDDLLFSSDREEGYGLAFDIGTTTVAAALVSLSDGRVLDTCSGWNRQGHRGRDVISRAQYTMENAEGLSRLSLDITSQLEDMALELLSAHGIGNESVRRIAVAGNTVMEHFANGLPVEKIVKAPFVPDTLFWSDPNFRLPGFPSAETFLMPCISGYVGGDIVSGLCSDDGVLKPEKSFVYLDIGTNGEVVLSDGKLLTCCSVAMGPAFEGARISCGMRSLTGAIDHFYCDGELTWTVIDGRKPVGICGTGIIELVSILLSHGIIDGTGRLLEADEAPGDDPLAGRLSADDDGMPVFIVDRENGIFLSASDIRKVQLAKRALITGIQLLCETKGMGVSDIDRIYIAGGFGKSLDIEACMNIGLLPGGIRDKTVYLGNASLKGCCRALCSGKTREKLLKTARQAGYMELSLSELFADRYIDNLNFREEI